MESANSLQSARMTRKLLGTTVAAPVVMGILLCLACGKRGDPKPPVPVIPQPTSDLAVTQRAEHVILSWSYPSLTTAGRSLTEIKRITVLRYVEELPVSAVTEIAPLQPADPGVPAPVARFAKIPTLPKEQFEKLATRVDSIEKANLASASTGARLLYTDVPPLRAQDGRPVRVTYAVVTESASARSEASNLAVIVPLAVANAPASLVATPKPEGVVLTWQEPKTAVGNAGTPIISGYHVYRTAPGETLDELAKPINTAPVKTTTYIDAPPYGDHEYRVTAVADEGPPLMQSDLSAPAKATFRDLVAPPTPASVTALLETKLVRLLWDPVEAPDLAGYLVYRIEREHRLKLSTGPLKDTNFTDISIDIGIAYSYEVTSIDTNGNESAPVKSETIIVPKTP